MKKLLGVSIAAMLAVTPMLANADPVTVTAAAAGDEPYEGVSVDNTSKIATTSFVQGAYNAAIGAVNDLASKKQNNLMNDVSENAAPISSTVKTTLETTVANASNTALVTEKAIATALNAVNTLADNAQTETEVKALIGGAATSGSGLSGNTENGTLAIDYDNSTIDLNAQNKLEVKDGAITFTKMNSGAVVTATAGINTTPDNANDDKLVTEKAVSTAIANATSANASSYAGNGLTNNDGALDVNLATNSGLNITNDAISVVGGAGITVGANGVAVDLKASNTSGLETDASTGKLGVVTDGTTIVIDSANNQLKVPAETFDTFGAASDLETKLSATTNGMTSIKVNGKEVATQTAVQNTMNTASVTIPVYAAWADPTSAGSVTVSNALTATYAEPTGA